MAGLDEISSFNDDNVSVSGSTTAPSPCKSANSGGSKANAVMVTMANGKRGYQYMNCNICTTTEGMTINQKSCKVCKRDTDHFFASTKKIDADVGKKRKAEGQPALEDSQTETAKIKKLRDTYADTDPPNPWSNEVQGYGKKCVQPGGVGTKKTCPDLASILNKLSHETVGHSQQVVPRDRWLKPAAF